MRKILWALVVAVFLSSAPVPVQAASSTHASYKRHKKGKKAKFAGRGKYKVHKFKNPKKASKLHR